MSGFETCPGEKKMKLYFFFPKFAEKCLQKIPITREWVSLNFSEKKILYLGWRHDMIQMPIIFRLLVILFYW